MNDRHNWHYNPRTATFTCIPVQVCHLTCAYKSRKGFTEAGCRVRVTRRELAAASIWLDPELNTALDQLANAEPVREEKPRLATIEDVLAEVVRPSGLIVPEGV